MLFALLTLVVPRTAEDNLFPCFSRDGNVIHVSLQIQRATGRYKLYILIWNIASLPVRVPRYSNMFIYMGEGNSSAN